MYKSKLQEFCQKKKLGLPRYCKLKDGPDHNPSFKASVDVNGRIFDAPISCKSSKEAENSAAKLAFLHFISEEEQTSIGLKIAETCDSLDVHSDASRGEPRAENEGERSKPVETHNSGESLSNTMNIKDDGPNQYKGMLQIYTRRNKLSMPVYSSQREEGQPHNLCFKATVTVDGRPFESPEFYNTLEEAENAAAQVALLTLSLDAFQESTYHSYKNSLQELATSEGFLLHKYTTKRSGEPHNPTFFSTVEVEGETFLGTAAKTKKQAESNAAKAACLSLSKCKASRTADSWPRLSCSEDKASALTDGSESPAADLSALSIADSEMEKCSKPESYLLCNRVRVYTSIPNVNFPEGTVLLPIDEDKWVPVSLDFCNERDA